MFYRTDLEVIYDTLFGRIFHNWNSKQISNTAVQRNKKYVWKGEIQGHLLILFSESHVPCAPKIC